MRGNRASALPRWIATLAGVVVIGAAVVWVILRVARPTLTVTQIVDGPVVSAFYATGTLEPEREFPIKSNIAGILTKVLVDKGDAVKKDQDLAVVRDDTAQTQRDAVDAEAEFGLKTLWADPVKSPLLKDFDERAQKLAARLSLAVQEKKRYESAHEHGAASETDLKIATDAVLQLESESHSVDRQREMRKSELDKERDAAKAKLDIAKGRLERTIKSPVDAIVLDRPTSPGTRVDVNGLIMLIADVAPDKLVMRAQVDEEDKALLALDQQVRISLYAFADQPFEGRVTRIYPKADPVRRTFEVDVRLKDAPKSFAAGMTGELVFTLEVKDSARVIPSQAVQHLSRTQPMPGQTSKGIVWVVRDGKLLTRAVTVGVRSVERTEIISGLEKDDQVVISPVGDTKAGRSVRTSVMDPQAAAALNRPTPSAFKGFGG